MSQEYPKKGDNYGQFSMKINGCPLFAHKYRTIEDKSKGASFSATTIPITLKYNVLGVFCFFIVRYLYGYSILKAKSFNPVLIQTQGMGFRKRFFYWKRRMNLICNPFFLD
jgi:hypothetical protein